MKNTKDAQCFINPFVPGYLLGMRCVDIPYLWKLFLKEHFLRIVSWKEICTSDSELGAYLASLNEP